MKGLKKDAYYITRKGEKQLWEKYRGIDDEIKKTTLAMGISDSIDSDLRENSEFMELRVKAMYTLPNQKKELYTKLMNPIIIDDMEEYKNFDGITVILGSTITLDMEGEEYKFTILGQDEGDLDNGILSGTTRLAQTILYHKVGDVIDFNNMEIKILKVEKFDLGDK